MTVIIGYSSPSDGSCYLAGDGFFGNPNINYGISKKIFKIGKYLSMGAAGSPRGAKILQTLLEHNQEFHSHDWLLEDFPELFRTAAKELGHSSIENNQENSGAVAVIAYNGKLYSMGAEFDATEILGNFTACGLGEEYALGAMDAMERSGTLQQDPKKALMEALKISARWCPCVTPPYTIIKTDKVL